MKFRLLHTESSPASPCRDRARCASRLKTPRGYAMAALLVGLSVMSVLLATAMPAWRHVMQREKEEELIFRGEQYARAIGLFQQKYAGAFPPSVKVLVDQKFLRKEYKDPMTENGEFQLLYQSPATRPGLQGGPGGTAGAKPGEGRPGAGGPAAPATPPASALTPANPAGGSRQPGGGTATSLGAQGGIIGVASKSKEKSIKIYKGRTQYSEWQFVYTAATQQPRAPGSPTSPGTPQGPGPALPGAPKPPVTPGSQPPGSPTQPGSIPR